jgi:hypothetical protein
MPEDRVEQNGKKERKNLTLAQEVVEAVQGYAETHGLYFGVAVEILVMQGLEKPGTDILPRMVGNVLERIVNRQFNRFAKLLAYTAVSAEAANQKADFLILQLLHREARQDPEHFITNLEVATEADVYPDALVRQVKEALCADIHAEAGHYLRKPLSEVLTQWQREVSDDADSA